MPKRTAWILALLLLPLVALGLRWASFHPSVIDWDESLYLLQAREWLRGNWPLSGVWDMHPVGAPGMIALAFLLLGESLGTVRLLGALCVAATGYALIGLVRNLGGGRSMAYAAALLYAAHSVLLGGLATNTEILFAPMVVASLALAVAPGGPWRRLLPMGALVGLALLVKPVAAPEGCLAFALLVLPLLRARRWREVGAMALAYAALCAAPTLLSGLAYALRGEFADWLNSSILAPLQYASGRMSAEQALWRSTLAALEFRWLLLLAAPAVAGLRAAEAAPRRVARFGLLWLAVALVGVIGPGHFFGHYFLLLLPPLSLLAALGLFLAMRALAGLRFRAAMLAVLAVVMADMLARDVAPRLSRGFALGSPDTPRRMAKLMNEELQPGDTIFVPNYQPVVYFLTEARLPTRFPFPVHLTGSFATLAGVDTDGEVQRILQSRPRFIVLDRSEWFGMRVSAMAMLSAALEEGYELAASFVEERGTVELWRRIEVE